MIRFSALFARLRRWLLVRHVRPPRTLSAALLMDDAPMVRRSVRYTSLQFTPNDAQSRMLTWRPHRLLVAYTRTMMGFILFVSRPRRIGMVGLGGGSLAKFCYRHLPDVQIDVVEISPEVVALRRTFRIPDDDQRFAVLIGDGARFVADRRGQFDALLVDGYDARGIPPALASQQFYDDCRAALAENGVLVVNLYCDDAEQHVKRIRHSFADAVVIVQESRQSNRVAFAWVGQALTDAELGMLERRFPRQMGHKDWAPLRPAFERIAVAARRRAALRT